MKDLSLIIPAYNERNRIYNCLEQYSKELRNLGYHFEIIVVDDGSDDSTVPFLRSIQTSFPELRVISCLENKGKGFAIKVGIMNALGKIHVFTDADASTPAYELPKLLQPLQSDQYSISIGSRYLDASEIIIEQPWIRKKWSRIANAIVQQSILPGIVDPHCGFKAFKAEVAQQLFSQLQVYQWSFDLEILALAKQANHEIIEVPVAWKNDLESKGSIKHLPREIKHFWKIRKRLKYA